MNEALPYRPEFVAALEKLGEACAWLEARGRPLPILVGGAVVEFDTGSAITSGDFDFYADDAESLAAALMAVGFERPSGPGRLLRGFIHPELLFAVEIIGGQYFDGHADRGRIRRLILSRGSILIAPTEDLIADRLGQWTASRPDKTMFNQALMLFRLTEGLDSAYLGRRLLKETAAEIGTEDLARLVNGDSDSGSEGGDHPEEA